MMLDHSEKRLTCPSRMDQLSIRDSNFSPGAIRAPFAKSAPEIAFRFSGCIRIISSKPPSPQTTAKKFLEVTIEPGEVPPPNSFRPSQATPTDVFRILQTTPLNFAAVPGHGLNARTRL